MNEIDEIADQDDWFGCYGGSTSRDDQLFTPASVAHPAKMSLPLLRRIFSEMQRREWLTLGESMVVDPFGGRGTTAAVWCAMHPANRAITVECEPHFLKMQRENHALAYRKLGRPLLWKMLRGDSRRIDQLLAGRGYAAVTSAPYGRGTIGQQGIDARALIERCPSLAGRNPEGAWFKAMEKGYRSESAANIDRLPDAVVTSAPYGSSQTGGGPLASGTLDQGVINRCGYSTDRHGVSPSQIGNMPDAAVTSAPYEAQSGGHTPCEKGTLDRGVLARHAAGQAHRTNAGYGENRPGQIGMMQRETYASACGQVYAALARAGVRYLVSVTKNPTRNKRLHRLDLLTANLLEAAGYRIVAARFAWLWMTQTEIDRRAGQATLFGEDEGIGAGKPRGRLSYFKRMQVNGGGIAAQWEDVLFAELEAADDGRAAVTSAPYFANETGGRAIYDAEEKRYGRRFTEKSRLQVNYGQSPAQIGTLKDSVAEREANRVD